MAVRVRQKIHEIERGVLKPEDGDNENLADKPFG